ncbi:MAG: hypothetical protein AB7O13_24780 [Alphaproteobacteria bacterium]
MHAYTARPRWAARTIAIALWLVGSAYLIKAEIDAQSPDWVVIVSTPIVWAVVITLPILAAYARRQRQWVAMAIIVVAALVGSTYTLTGTLGRQAAARDNAVAKAAEVGKARQRIEHDLARAKAMLEEARAKCATGRRCYDSTRATISVYEGAVAGHEHRLAKLRTEAPTAGERRIAALIAAVSGRPMAEVAEIVGLIVPSLFGFTLELAAFASAMLGWHPERTSVPFSSTVQSTVQPEPTPPKPRRTFRKDEARADVLQFRRPVQQETLAGRWGVTKSMVSMWLADWETEGLVQRARTGKYKTVQSQPGRLTVVN